VCVCVLFVCVCVCVCVQYVPTKHVVGVTEMDAI